MKGEFLPGKTAMKLSVAYGTIDPNAPLKPAMKFTTQTVKGQLLFFSKTSLAMYLIFGFN